MRSNLFDINGKEIEVGQRIRIYSRDYEAGNIWETTVTFEDGVYTVSLTDTKQIQNPDGWEMSHDWIKSRNWSVKVGYGEYGNWNCPRRPLTEIHSGFGLKFEDEYKPLCEKYGYGKRYLNVEIIDDNVGGD